MSLRPATALLALLLASPLPATTYYVSENGDDSADGTTPDTAWASLQRAADAAAPGDTVIALPGTYEGFNLFAGGTAGEPVTFTANPGVPAPNPQVVIDRPNGFTGVDGVNLEGASHVVVEGFTIVGTGSPAVSRAGVRAVGFAGGHASHVTVRHNRVTDPGRWGIFTGFVDDLVVEGNETNGAVEEHGVYVSNSGDRPVVRGNVIRDNFANGIHMNGDASLGGDGVISGALVEGNVISGNGLGGGSGINCDGVVDSTIVNNLIHDQHASGISLYRIDGGAPSTGNLVVANTVLVAADGRWAMNVQDGSSGNRLVGNVFLSEHPDRGSIDLCGDCLAGTVSDHNAVEDRFSLDDVWIDLATWRAETGQDGASFLAGREELFVDPAGDDYRLAEGSPAVDAGTGEDAPAVDLVGVPRPQGAEVDVGAYERATGLLLVGPEPGLAGQANRLAAHGAEPGAEVRFVAGVEPGEVEVPGCAGVVVEIAEPRSVGAGVADAGGTVEVEVEVPRGAEGVAVRFQAVEPAGCGVAPVVEWTFGAAPPGFGGGDGR